MFAYTAGSGHDVIADFVHGSDKIVLTGTANRFSSYSDVVAHITGSLGVTIDLGDGSDVTIYNMAPGSLSADDFAFAYV